MDVRLPDGTLITNVPEGTSKADLTAKLIAKGYDPDIAMDETLKEISSRTGAFNPETGKYENKLEEITRTGKIFTKKETNIIYILLAAIGLALVIFTGLGPAIISGSVLAVLIKVHKGNKEMMNSLGLSSTDSQSDNDFAFFDDMNLGM